MDGHQRGHSAGQLDLGADRHAAADPGLVAAPAEPAAIDIEPDQEGAMQPQAGGDRIAMQPAAVAPAGEFAAQRRAAEIELDELDPIGVAVAEAPGELGDAAAVARSRHAVIDLAQESDIGLERGQRGGDGVGMSNLLDVPDRDADRSIGPLAVRRRATDLDLVQGGDRVEVAAMSRRVARPVAHGIAVGERHRGQRGNDGVDGFGQWLGHGRRSIAGMEWRRDVMRLRPAIGKAIDTLRPLPRSFTRKTCLEARPAGHELSDLRDLRHAI